MEFFNFSTYGTTLKSEKLKNHKSLKARMLNEAEAFTLKNKKYATADDLMTSENSFLNCFRPKDFNLSVRIFNNFVIFRENRHFFFEIFGTFCEKKMRDC